MLVLIRSARSFAKFTENKYQKKIVYDKMIQTHAHKKRMQLMEQGVI